MGRHALAIIATAALLGAELLVAQPALAGTVRGTIRLPGRFKQQRPFDRGGFWRVPNGVLKIAPPLRSAQESMVVALEGEGLAGRPAPAPPVLQMVDARFDPPVLAVAPGTRVTLENKDPAMHLIEVSGVMQAKRFDPGDKIQQVLERKGSYTVRCDEYPHMRGTILVTDKPVFSVPSTRGDFKFQDVPPGTYKLSVWYAGKWIYSQLLTVRGGVNVQVKLPPSEE